MAVKTGMSFPPVCNQHDGVDETSPFCFTTAGLWFCSKRPSVTNKSKSFHVIPLNLLKAVGVKNNFYTFTFCCNIDNSRAVRWPMWQCDRLSESSGKFRGLRGSSRPAVCFHITHIQPSRLCCCCALCRPLGATATRRQRNVWNVRPRAFWYKWSH